MKIAVVTDNGSTISRHFGRALGYLVFTIEAGEIVEKEQRAKPIHQQCGHEDHEHHNHVHLHGIGEHPVDHHAQMLDPIRDCEAVLVRGMGAGAYYAMEQADIRPFITDVDDAETAVRAYVEGTLIDHPERLH